MPPSTGGLPAARHRRAAVPRCGRELGGAGRWLGLADEEGLLVAGAVGVSSAGGAGARGGAGDCVDLGVSAGVEGGGAGDFFGSSPGAVDLADDECLGVAGAVGVGAADGAVAR